MLHVNDETLRRLGWPRLLSAVADRCATDLGRDAALGLPLLDTRDAVVTELGQIGDLMAMADADAELPISDVYEIRPHLRRAEQGSVIDVDGLRDVARTAETLARVRRHLTFHAERRDKLAPLAASLPDVGLLADELGATFDASGDIRDDASPELAEARKRRNRLHQAIKKRLDEYLLRQDVQEVLQDDYYTQRDGRYVIPVVSSFQSQIDGIIHGSSNTGQTVYLEPGSFIDANNQIKVAEAAVEVAEYKVLQERSAWIAEEAPALRDGLAALLRLDVLQARARLARDLDAHVPKVVSEGTIKLENARNPLLLLQNERVIPNDIVLESGRSFLVVTGPNTGGKTVTLNTLGLLTLMTHAAIPVPADPDSEVVLFEAIFALVGDAQDIERHLSTFSGHMLALKEMIDEVHDGSLVLLDEIVVGTEPVQGSALAIAVLESLATRGARGLVTTHYERLKALPFEDERFVNASVGLDPDTLEPNFRLKVGQPGSSTPFEVAQRLGLSSKLIDRAREIAGGHGGLTEALAKLDDARAEAEAATRDAERVRRELEAEREALERRADEEVREARAEAFEAVERAMDVLRERVAAAQRSEDPRELETIRQDVLDVEEGLRASDEAGEPAPKKEAKPVKTKPKGPHDAGDLPEDALEVGADVWVRSLGQRGQIVDVRGPNKVMVSVGPLKTTVKAGDLGALGGVEAPKPKASAGRSTSSRPAPRRLDPDAPDSPPPRTGDITADLRGMRRDEVEDVLLRDLDRAYSSNREALWIIHGHGTGALRDEVRDLVRTSEYVDRWRPGLRHEGGDGVTIAWLHRD